MSGSPGAGPVVVREVDGRDLDLLRPWWEIGRAASAARAIDLWTPWEQAQTLWTLPPVGREVLTLAAFDTSAEGEPMVGAGRLMLPEQDNTHLVLVELYVHPERARQGIGSDLLAAMEQLATERGRSTLIGRCHQRPDAGSPAGLAFAAAAGYPTVGRDELKAVDLAATEQSWPALAQEAAERQGDYELVWWADAVPETHLGDMLELMEVFSDEAPAEGADLRTQDWDASRLRRIEERRHRSGYRQMVVAARAPDGRLVGYSDVLRATTTPHWAGIDRTIVAPGHRGHRLGLAMKVRLHQLVRERFPECATIITGNAGTNRHMNAVNARLGYAVVEVEHVVQKVLGA